MPRGSSDVPELRLEVLQDFVTQFTQKPDLLLMSLFPESDSPSSSIMWESKRGGRGMTPFVPPGSPAPQTSPHGIAQHRAEAAYWKEKMPFDEEFLNNLRKEGTSSEHKSATERLAEEMAGLINRSNRRKEWMYAQMLFNGSFSYQMRGGYMATVNYSVPSDHMVSLAAAFNWNNGASKNIIADIQAGKRKIKEDCGAKVDLAICNSQVLTYLANDTTIRALLTKAAFGDGGLFKGNLHDVVGVNPSVIGSLLDIPKLVVYDEMYEVRAWLTAAVVPGQSWISVDDVSDLSVGDKVRFHDYSAGTFEDRFIFAVNQTGAIIQLSQGVLGTYRAREDYITMKKYYVPDDKFVMLSTKVDGRPIGKFFRAPFGVNRHWGILTDKNDEWDPEVTWIRVQDKGLPVLLNRDGVYVIDVLTPTPAENISTSSTSSSTSSSASTTSSTSSTASTTSSTSSTASTASTTSSTSSTASTASTISTTSTTVAP